MKKPQGVLALRSKIHPVMLYKRLSDIAELSRYFFGIFFGSFQGGFTVLKGLNSLNVHTASHKRQNVLVYCLMKAFFITEVYFKTTIFHNDEV